MCLGAFYAERSYLQHSSLRECASLAGSSFHLPESSFPISDKQKGHIPLPQYMSLFFSNMLFLPFCHLFHDVIPGDPAFCHQHHHMIQEVAHLIFEFFRVRILRCNDDLGSLFSNLLQNFITGFRQFIKESILSLERIMHMKRI